MSARKDFITGVSWLFGLLAVMGGTGYGAYRYYVQNYQKPRELHTHLREVGRALDLYFQDCKDLPTAEQGLSALHSPPRAEPVCKGWDGPYFEESALSDPWGRPFVYGREGAYFTLKTLGKDGAAGGSSKDADVSIEDL